MVKTVKFKTEAQASKFEDLIFEFAQNSDFEYVLDAERQGRWVKVEINTNDVDFECLEQWNADGVLDAINALLASSTSDETNVLELVRPHYLSRER